MSACCRAPVGGGRALSSAPEETVDFLPGQEARERLPPVPPDTPRRVGIEVPVCDRELHDMAEKAESGVGIAGGGPAEAVEPAPDLCRGDAVQRLRAEGREYPSRDHIPYGPLGSMACTGRSVLPSRPPR